MAVDERGVIVLVAVIARAMLEATEQATAVVVRDVVMVVGRRGVLMHGGE